MSAADIDRLTDAVSDAIADDLPTPEIVRALLKALPLLDYGDAPNYRAGLWDRRNLDRLIEDLLNEEPTDAR